VDLAGCAPDWTLSFPIHSHAMATVITARPVIQVCARKPGQRGSSTGEDHGRQRKREDAPGRTCGRSGAAGQCNASGAGSACPGTSGELLEQRFGGDPGFFGRGDREQELITLLPQFKPKKATTGLLVLYHFAHAVRRRNRVSKAQNEIAPLVSAQPPRETRYSLGSPSRRPWHGAIKLCQRTNVGAVAAPAAAPAAAPTGPATAAPKTPPTAAPPTRCSVVVHAAPPEPAPR